MGAQGNSGANIGRAVAPRNGESRLVAAARVRSIDYRSIVDNAVAGLADNTPDTRREVYAQARGVVNRHLWLMELPEPIVELEKLALDLAIKKIEQHWRTREANENPVPAPASARRIKRNGARQAQDSRVTAPAARATAPGSLSLIHI